MSVDKKLLQACVAKALESVTSTRAKRLLAEQIGVELDISPDEAELKYLKYLAEAPENFSKLCDNAARMRKHINWFENKLDITDYDQNNLELSKQMLPKVMFTLHSVKPYVPPHIVQSLESAYKLGL